MSELTENVAESGERLMTWREWREFNEASAVEFADRLCAIDLLHRREGGKCAECGKAWPCPTAGCAGVGWKAP